MSSTNEVVPADPPVGAVVTAAASTRARAYDTRDVERWLNEGGHLATDALLARELGGATEMTEDRHGCS